MANTKLHLDFSLNTAQERKEFLDKYLEENKHLKWTDKDLEMMGNYVLWGKDKNGEPVADTGHINIETTHSTWKQRAPESLDALMEQPTFNEAAVFFQAPTKPVKAKFDREQALREAPGNIRETLVNLFRDIDTIDLMINFYELHIGKRTKEPREELWNRFTNDERIELQQKAINWKQFEYLKKRHLLVELRNQQFTLRDGYTSVVQRTTMPELNLKEDSIDFEGNITVFPLGLYGEDSLMRLVFKEPNELNPYSYTEQELETVSKFLWDKKSKEKENEIIYFDFRDEKHLAELFHNYIDLENSENKLTQDLIKTINYYIKFSTITDAQKDLLDLKIQKKTNEEIRAYINEKYDKHYAVNYISTIFRQKIIPSIAAAASYHLMIVENLFFQEEFKKCTSCGEYLLINEKNFMRESRSKDGFGSKCKKCEKKRRSKK